MNKRREQAWAKWRGVVAEREQSGQSVAAFCRDRELARSQLLYWKKRVREAAKAPFVEVQLVQPGVEPRVQAPALGSPTIEVRLKNGRSLMVGASFDARHLRALLGSGGVMLGLPSLHTLDHAPGAPLCCESAS